MLDIKTHRFFFLLGTIAIAVALPFSPVLLSVGQIIISVNWVLEFGFKKKLDLLWQRKSIFLFMLIYIIHVLWLFNSKNYSYALHDLKIKLPIFVLPLIFGTTQSLSRNEFKLILHFLLTSVLLATFVSVVIFLGLTKIEPFNYRYLSIFISHIRFSLLIVLCIYIILSLLICYRQYQYLKPWAYILLLAWFSFFILFLGASTGLIVLLLVSPFALFFWFNTKQGKNYKRIGASVLSLIILFIFGYLTYALIKYQSRNKVDVTKLEKYTVNGNKYAHYPNNKDYENNDRVWLYVCDKELKKGWDEVSSIKYEGKDKMGQFIRTTLVRYLTSMGYRKDSVGVSKLTDEDIRMIEDGYTNFIYKNRLSVYPRLYQLFWEIEEYLRYNNPGGHSLTQRIEYIKNAFHVIDRHFWLGTGTGDVDDEIQLQYQLDNSNLAERWQFRAHDQIVTFFLTFGLVGFLILVAAIFFTLKLERKNIDFIAFTFLLIVLFSMFNEDTFETQAGATFLAFFFSLLIFGRKLASD